MPRSPPSTNRRSATGSSGRRSRSSPSTASIARRCRTSSAHPGLSVGAIYTYFKSKSDLILAGCDLITDQELGQLGGRLATVTGYRERIATAIGYWFDNLAVEQSDRGSGFLLLQAWAEVDTDPAIREMLLRRRRETVTSIVLILQEGVMRGELPAWLDVAAIAQAISALLDGMLIEADRGRAPRSAAPTRAADPGPPRDHPRGS